ncbi:11732_t:CDS:1, partial [Cetraspora pellucida]
EAQVSNAYLIPYRQSGTLEETEYERMNKYFYNSEAQVSITHLIP